jgi:hypothetical protein
MHLEYMIALVLTQIASRAAAGQQGRRKRWTVSVLVG